MGIKYKLKLKDLKFEYLKEYFIPFLKYFKKTKKNRKLFRSERIYSKKICMGKPSYSIWLS